MAASDRNPLFHSELVCGVPSALNNNEIETMMSAEMSQSDVLFQEKLLAKPLLRNFVAQIRPRQGWTAAAKALEKETGTILSARSRRKYKVPWSVIERMCTGKMAIFRSYFEELVLTLNRLLNTDAVFRARIQTFYGDLKTITLDQIASSPASSAADGLSFGLPPDEAVRSQFFGRPAEIQALRQIWRDKKIRVAWIEADGGAGKT